MSSIAVEGLRKQYGDVVTVDGLSFAVEPGQVFGLLGPQWMQTIAMALPTGWTMDAMHKLVSFADAPATAVPHVAALALAALAAGWAGAKLFRYQ